MAGGTEFFFLILDIFCGAIFYSTTAPLIVSSPTVHLSSSIFRDIVFFPTEIFKGDLPLLSDIF